MPKSQLYLVRRELETFTGPVTADELLHHLDRMAIGMRDEICGHCGPWVFLDDREKLKMFYPELLSRVQSAAIGGWSADVGAFRNEPTIKGIAILPRRKADRRVLVAAAFFGLAIIAAVVAWLLAGSAELSSRIIGSPAPQVAEFNALLQSGKVDEFAVAMEAQLPRIINRANRNQEAFGVWLPYLRTYAFNERGVGEIDGIQSKKLRGEAPVSAPADCSVRSWVKRWREAGPSLTAVARGESLPSDHWGRLLAWDPYWIGRRSQKGWLHPRNFYHGCVLTALRALESIDVGPDAEPARQRLAVMAALIQDQKSSDKSMLKKLRESISGPNKRTATAFGLWTCLDLAQTRTELDVCLESPWHALMESDYNREKFYWSMLRLAVKAQSAGNTAAWPLLRNDLQAFIVGRDYADSYTRLDYTEEMQFVGTQKGILPESMLVPSVSSSSALSPSALSPSALSPSAPTGTSGKSSANDIQVDLAH